MKRNAAAAAIGVAMTAICAAIASALQLSGTPGARLRRHTQRHHMVSE